VKVSVVGLGYVGAVTGACLAELGHEVVCVDLDERRVRELQEGRSPVFEPGLDELVQKHAGDRLTATQELRAAVTGSELTLIAVGTPFDGREIDLGAVRSATTDVGAALRDKPGYHVVVVKSTVVPGTTRDVVVPLLEQASGKEVGADLGVGMNPEFLTEGQAVDDFMAPDRLVLGGMDGRVHERLEELYAAFSPEIPRVHTNTTTAETIKYASNAMLATAISFANEIADLCAALDDADVVDVMHGVHLSRYLTPLAADGSAVRAPLAAFYEAGCGFGGSCLPKDLRALVARGAQLGRTFPVLEATLQTNEARPDELVAVVRHNLQELAGARITVLGLAFKPDTDDVRESPAVPIIKRLVDEGAVVTVHDPVVRDMPEELLDQQRRVELATSLEQAVRDADAIVLVTRWEQYRELPTVLNGMERQPLFVDGRRMLDKQDFPRYAGVGIAR
jgi:UDPglucose 6-dehydrogenase/GDP-mannose 6-dehydrogenase